MRIGLLASLVFVVATTVTHAADLPKVIEETAPSVVAIAWEEPSKDVDKAIPLMQQDENSTEEWAFRDRYLYLSQQAPKTAAFANGLVISDEGLIVAPGPSTLPENAEKIRVTLANRKSFDAKRLVVDGVNELTLLKIDAGDERLDFIDPSAVDTKVGESLVSITRLPTEMEIVASVGILSAKNRSISSNINGVLQTDLQSSPGSQAQVVDEDGDGVEAAFDCDDADRRSYPGAEEVCDGADNDCDGVIDEGVSSIVWPDGDGDGHGDATADPVRQCEVQAGFVIRGGDCNDADATIAPDAAEDCSSVDRNCDGEPRAGAPGDVWYADVDRDGFGDDDDTQQRCGAPSGYAPLGGDCDDTDPAIRPDAEEQCNDVDDDCDGQIDNNAVDVATQYEDRDGDGFGVDGVSISACPGTPGWASFGGDCNDQLPTISPGRIDICNGGVDDDCDPAPTRTRSRAPCGSTMEIWMASAPTLRGCGRVTRRGPTSWRSAVTATTSNRPRSPVPRNSATASTMTVTVRRTVMQSMPWSTTSTPTVMGSATTPRPRLRACLCPIG